MKISKFHLFESSGYDHDYLPEIENIINTLRDDGFKCSVNHYYFSTDDKTMSSRDSIWEESLPLLEKYKRVYMVSCRYDDREDRGDISCLEKMIDTVKRLEQISDKIDYNTISGMGFFMRLIFTDYSYPNSKKNITDWKKLIEDIRNIGENKKLEISPSVNPDNILSEDPISNYDDREWSLGLVRSRRNGNITSMELINLISDEIIKSGGDALGEIYKFDGRYRRGVSRYGYYKQKMKFRDVEFILVCDARDTFPSVWMCFKKGYYWGLRELGFNNR